MVDLSTAIPKAIKEMVLSEIVVGIYFINNSKGTMILMVGLTYKAITVINYYHHYSYYSLRPAFLSLKRVGSNNLCICMKGNSFEFPSRNSLNQRLDRTQRILRGSGYLASG